MILIDQSFQNTHETRNKLQESHTNFQEWLSYTNKNQRSKFSSALEHTTLQWNIDDFFSEPPFSHELEIRKNTIYLWTAKMFFTRLIPSIFTQDKRAEAFTKYKGWFRFWLQGI